MRESLGALLTGIVDYAGLFPPAKLPLDEAISNYLRYRTSPESWMLGRFVLPLKRLEELQPFLSEAAAAGQVLSIAGLGRGADTVAEFLAGMAAEGQAVRAFNHEYSGRAKVDVYESRLPAAVLRLHDTASLRAEMMRIREQAEHTNLPLFFELPLAGGWQTLLAALCQVLRGWESPRVGMKIRCGGPEPQDFPTAGQLAAVIAACRDHGLPLKFTAGLHQPFRRFDAGVGATMHGFLNVFGAGVQAFANHLTDGEIQTIIEDDDAADFVFDTAGFRWKQHLVSSEKIGAARSDFVTSFGSCSFGEPCDDLRELGLIA